MLHEGYFVEGSSRLRLSNNKTVPIVLAQKGMELYGGGVVECVVRTPFDDSVSFVEIPPKSGKKPFRVLPLHPVFDDTVHKWTYAQHLAPSIVSYKPPPESWMVALLLESVAEDEKDLVNHMMVENYWCSVLGHGCVKNELLFHEYFSTHKVVDDVRLCKGYRKGLVSAEFRPIDADSFCIFEM